MVIHRDGYFRGEEKQALGDWGKKIGATFYLIEVIKTGTPRLYGLRGSAVILPEKGNALKVSDTEAILVSSLPPFEDATPQPLRTRTDGSLSLGDAIHSVLSLTLLHFGSRRAPRLPVTIHYSDRIAYLALRGIEPKTRKERSHFGYDAVGAPAPSPIRYKDSSSPKNLRLQGV